LKEQNTVNEIAAKYGISGSIVSSWKKQFLSGGFLNILVRRKRLSDTEGITNPVQGKSIRTVDDDCSGTA
jgi:transposase-like protein